MKKKIIKIVSITIAVFLVLWIIAGTVDFLRMKSFERPLFIMSTKTADDGGSGMYYGAGYSFEIEGNFMPEDELPGVTNYKYYLFGNLISEGNRN